MDHKLLPRVLIFPLPIQSPVNSMMKLAELLCLAGLQVTFLITKYNHKRLLHCTDIQTRLAEYHGQLHLETIEDGLPEDDPRNVEKFAEIIDSLQTVGQPFLRELLQENMSRNTPITCVIAEGFYYYALDITGELGIPLIFFETISPCCLWVYFCLTKLMEDGQLPFKGDDLDTLVTSIPGMEGVLRFRDLPDFCRRDYSLDGNARLVFKSIQAYPRAVGLILNSFAELESPVSSHLRSKVPHLYMIRLVQLHLKKAILQGQQSQEYPNLSNSFWVEDRNCLKWLDSQPSKSVIYISFGSLFNLSNEELLEFWHGVMKSGYRFLWLIRPGSIKEQNDGFLKGLNDKTNDLGLIVSWCPQEEVLAHPAIGGFLTHSGWNSTLESIIGMEESP
ncbi:OLC1v1026678C1 [Oldenlandia corymbosa var. corymbosa]|uniref:OLC1v1026678C1 n=1 Tax=Oldenlandia corymbosa var. corymbosa TaxID=529605 RepID=A0AAV1C7X0_OLDCO|nr:OLC1v1026678C1 [Oldenlandia corymbosa var. corymbosa]